MPLKLQMDEIQSIRIVGYNMRIMATAFGREEDKPVVITTDCVTLAQLEHEVSSLQEDLKAILDQARAKFAAQASGAPDGPKPLPLPRWDGAGGGGSGGQPAT